MKNIDKELDRYFHILDSTIALVEELIKDKRYPQEVLVLLCSRLDALASNGSAEGTPNAEAFPGFVTHYGGYRQLFESISVGDVYYELGFHRWLVEGTVFKTGRIRRFSRVDDPIIDLYVKSGIPITVRDVGRFVDKIMLAIKAKYRAVPRQSTKKALLANGRDIENTIVSAFPGARAKEIRSQLPAALKALLQSKRMSALLYQRFRNESIHGGKVLLNETRFFAESQPYWEGEHSPYFGGYQLAEFPAQFLLDVLRNCIRTFRAHIAAKKKIPPDVHFHVFEGLEHLEFLDYALLPVVRDLVPK